MDIQPIGYLFLEALQKKRLKKLRKIRVNFHRFNRSRDDEKLLENIPSQYLARRSNVIRVFVT